MLVALEPYLKTQNSILTLRTNLVLLKDFVLGSLTLSNSMKYTVMLNLKEKLWTKLIISLQMQTQTFKVAASCCLGDIGRVDNAM